ncbi:MAG TPA: EamA family transporter [Vicinamibacterales bacterium]|jgi:drug/metabolite transporter (DMT)-like permease
MTADRHRRRAWLAWAAVCIIWGTTYLAIRVSIETMPPILMAGLRWTIAGSLIATYLVATGERLPTLHAWPGIVLLGFLLLGLGNGGVVWAEQWVTSGLSAVIVGTCPFWMAAVEAARRDGERLTAGVVTGLVIGFCGIVLLVWPELSHGGTAGRHFVAGVISLQVACFGWALGSSYSKRRTRDDHVFGTAAAQMLAGGIMMLAAGTLHGDWAAFSVTGRTALAFAYLATVGAIGGFVAYTYALRHLEVSRVSLYAYVNPVIAVALGVALLGEPFTARMAIAAGLVFAGVAAIQLRQTVRPLIRRTRNSTIAITSRT